MRKTAASLRLISGLAFLCSIPAVADVKTGVDAWTQGDYATAMREWQPAADKGDADALFNLAQAYRLGLGTKQNLVKAEELYSKAAAKGHPHAADYYGVLLFQRGRRTEAMPYIRTAAARGEPRAQYLLGLAHFNGDYAEKDWVRAYALTSLAQRAGLAPAAAALADMDRYIPLDQRQEAATLAIALDSQAEATRARQLASADLGVGEPGPLSDPGAPRPPVITARPTIPTPDGAITEAGRLAGNDSYRTAGADYARPQVPTAIAAPNARPAPTPSPRPAVTPASAPPAPAGGPWRVQLGAFSVAANADALWNRVRNRPELSGHGKVTVRAGTVTKLQAGGFASQAEAQSACTRLSAAGFSCLATRN